MKCTDCGAEFDHVSKLNKHKAKECPGPESQDPAAQEAKPEVPKGNGRHVIPKAVAPMEYKYLKPGYFVRFMTYGKLLPNGDVEVERTEYVS